MFLAPPTLRAVPTPSPRVGRFLPRTRVNTRLCVACHTAVPRHIGRTHVREPRQRVSPRDLRLHRRNLCRHFRQKTQPSRTRLCTMSQESPEQQMPLALSPNALAQKDVNAMPTEYPKSIGKKLLDARYAARVSGARNKTRRKPGKLFFHANSRICIRRPPSVPQCFDPSSFPPKKHISLLPRFRSPTDSNMSPASKFVHAKKGGKKAGHGCVFSKFFSFQVFALCFDKAKKTNRRRRLAPPPRCMPSQLEGNFRRAVASGQLGAGQIAAPSRFGAQK
jgi:hypothetical protein